MIDLDFVTEGLAVGASFPSEAVPTLAARYGITQVVDVRGEACDDAATLARHGIGLLHLPTEDTLAVSRRMIGEGVIFVSAALDRGERVLVHCQYGIGRSALMALCVLVARGHAPLQAMTLVKAGRPVASPSPEQLEAFIAYCAEGAGAPRAAGAVPRFEELAEVAYRHLRTGRTRREARRASTRSG